MRRLISSLFLLFLYTHAPPGAWAHTDRWAFSDFVFEDARVLFTLRTTIRDVAEVVRVDKNGDGEVTKEELASGGADLLAYLQSRVAVTANGRPLTPKLAGIDEPRGFDPPWPILSIDKIWFVIDVVYESPERIREVTVGARLFDAIPHHLNKGKMVRGDDERPWLFNEDYHVSFAEVAPPAPAAGEAHPAGSAPKASPSAEVSTKADEALPAGPDPVAAPASLLPADVPPPAPPAPSSPSVVPVSAPPDVVASAPSPPSPPPAVPSSMPAGVTSATEIPPLSPRVAVSGIPPPPRSFTDGLQHAWSPDHLLFAAGIALVASRFRNMAEILGVFLAANAAGMLMTTTQVWRVPPALSEEVFALMLVFLGIENLLIKREDRRRLLAGLGVLHGAVWGAYSGGAPVVSGWAVATAASGAAFWVLFAGLRRWERLYRFECVVCGSVAIAGVGIVRFFEQIKNS